MFPQQQEFIHREEYEKIESKIKDLEDSLKPLLLKAEKKNHKKHPEAYADAVEKLKNILEGINQKMGTINRWVNEEPACATAANPLLSRYLELKEKLEKHHILPTYKASNSA